jgi:Tfp pilus assembly ATPase PilU
VHISFREIRQYGAGSIQIARRLRAAIENLIQSLPEQRHDALRVELTLLDRAIVSQFTFPEDLALARIPDLQGLGGSTASTAND